MNNYDISSYDRINSENEGTLTGLEGSVKDEEEQTIIKTLAFLECVLSEDPFNIRRNVTDQTFNDYIKNIEDLKDQRSPLLSETMRAYLHNLNTVLGIARHTIATGRSEDDNKKTRTEAIVRAHDLGIAESNQDCSKCQIIKIRNTVNILQAKGITVQSMGEAGPGFNIRNTDYSKTPNGARLPGKLDFKINDTFDNNFLMLSRKAKELLKKINILYEQRDDLYKQRDDINNLNLENLCLKIGPVDQTVINPDTSPDVQKELDEVLKKLNITEKELNEALEKLNKIEEKQKKELTVKKEYQRTEEEKQRENFAMSDKLKKLKQELATRRLKRDGASPNRSQL